MNESELITLIRDIIEADTSSNQALRDLKDRYTQVKKEFGNDSKITDFLGGLIVGRFCQNILFRQQQITVVEQNERKASLKEAIRILDDIKTKTPKKWWKREKEK